MTDDLEEEEIRTPAMNNPKATPTFLGSETYRTVSAGCQRLPGVSSLENPSIIMQHTIRIVEIIPKTEAYAKTERGKNIVGIKL